MAIQRPEAMSYLSDTRGIFVAALVLQSRPNVAQATSYQVGAENMSDQYGAIIR